MLADEVRQKAENKKAMEEAQAQERMAAENERRKLEDEQRIQRSQLAELGPYTEALSEFNQNKMELQGEMEKAINTGDIDLYNELADRMAKLEQDWIAKQEEIADKDLQVKQDALDSARDLLQKATEGGIEEDIIKAKEALKDAYNELEQAQGKKGEQNQRRLDALRERQEQYDDALKGWKKGLVENVMDGIKASEVKFKVDGTFNAFDATRQANGNADSLLNQTRQQTDLLKRLEKLLQSIDDGVDEWNGEAVFA